MSSGIVRFSGGEALIARGSERSAWWIMRPRSAGTAGVYYYRARGPVASGDILPGAVAGASLTAGVGFTAAYGSYRRLQGVNNAAPCYLTIAPVGLQFSGAAMSAPLGAVGSGSEEVLIYRESIQLFNSGPPPAGHCAMHGFSLVGNLLAGFPQLGAGSWRGIALCQLVANTYAVAVKNANPATMFPLTGIDLTAGRTLVEHRLYWPTASRMGRYELYINETLALTVNGDHPNFPVPLATAELWNFMPFSLNNPGGVVVTEQRSAWGEIIIGPDSEGTY